jgi:alpha-1,3-glucan synthase
LGEAEMQSSRLIAFAGYDVPPDLVDTWNVMLTTNDMLNANTGKFDPRHMWGASNQVCYSRDALILVTLS